jgi:hypothetical protein
MTTRRKSPGAKKRRGPGAPNVPSGIAFWGDPGSLDDDPELIRVSDDPGALVRSLGPPPLSGQERTAELYLAVMYDKAAALAAALAASADMLDDLDDESG